MSPRGIPTIGSGLWPQGSQVLGSIPHDMLDPTPMGETTLGDSVTLTEPPPPWEVASNDTHALSDARRFVEVPENIEVRWINPKVLDAEGWRDWQPVMASDPRFSVKVFTMVSPDNNIRRGGPTGDILAWMYKSWVLARRKQFAERTAAQTTSTVDQQRQLQEDMRRGKYGRGVGIDSAKHPEYTLADGKSLQRDE